MSEKRDFAWSMKIMNEGSFLPPIESTRHQSFLDSLYKFIEDEKEQVACSESEPNEQRFVIYRAAFDKVIEQATGYKNILSAIKREYDRFISTMKKSLYDAKLIQSKVKAMEANPVLLMTCQSRAAQLQERIETIQTDTAELQTELKALQDSQAKKRSLEEQNLSDCRKLQLVGHIPGLMLEGSLNIDALDRHLEYLRETQINLLNKRLVHYVPVQVMTDLDSELRRVLEQRDTLLVQNKKLQLRHRQLRFVKDALYSWERSGSKPSLVEFLPLVLQKVSQLKACDSDEQSNSLDFDQDDFGKINKSKLVVEYVERFMQLLKSGDYEAATSYAAASPQVVWQNPETVERFKAAAVSEGELPPLLLFFQALMTSVHDGKWLPSEALSVEGVRCALQRNHVEQVTHWVTQKRLTFSEALGDVICEYAGNRVPQLANTCLGLAQVVYTECGICRKAVACLCRRGLTNTAVELIHQDGTFTVDDCLTLMRSCPSLTLLQGLTQEYRGQQAILSAGSVIHGLLTTGSADIGLQLLTEIHVSRTGALERTILNDGMCTAVAWAAVAERCRQCHHDQLSKEIFSVLVSQAGVMPS